jgi:hypothetical protein
LAAFADSVGQNPNGPGKPIPPGQEINLAKDLFPGVSTPVAVGEFVNGVYASQGVTTTFGPVPPGSIREDFHTWLQERSYGNRSRSQRRGVDLPLKSADRVAARIPFLACGRYHVS